MGPLYLIIWSGNVGERQERKTRAKKKKKEKQRSIWIIICLPFRQRLTAGALVCDQLDMCAFNKPGQGCVCAATGLGPEL